MKIDGKALADATKITISSNVGVSFLRVSQRVLKRLRDLEVAEKAEYISIPEIVRLEAVMATRNNFSPFLDAINHASNPRHFSITEISTETHMMTVEAEIFVVPVRIVIECQTSG